MPAATTTQAENTGKSADGRGIRRTITGTVTSNAMDKTIVVSVVRRVRDPVYGKYVKRAKRFHAHDEKEEYKTNDVVEIRESRPLSATKRWTAIRLVERPEEV